MFTDIPTKSQHLITDELIYKLSATSDADLARFVLILLTPLTLFNSNLCLSAMSDADLARFVLILLTPLILFNSNLCLSAMSDADLGLGLGLSLSLS